ncbi:MAG: hypothetical protein LBF15_05220 [Candidatus Peribacteria bacterium]|jgi:hypothetical protein|nr:hypothetical protein [Candidatus Peribacteria bacterium]
MNLPRNSNLSKVLFEEVKKRAEKASKEGNYEYEDEDEDNVPTLAYSQDFGDSL